MASTVPAVTAKVPANGTVPPVTAKVPAIGLDDDDEFEEFPLDGRHIDVVEDDEKDTIWEDNWEDETVGEDFSTELRAELEKMGHKPMI